MNDQAVDDIVVKAGFWCFGHKVSSRLSISSFGFMALNAASQLIDLRRFEQSTYLSNSLNIYSDGMIGLKISYCYQKLPSSCLANFFPFQKGAYKSPHSTNTR